MITAEMLTSNAGQVKALDTFYLSSLIFYLSIMRLLLLSTLLFALSACQNGPSKNDNCQTQPQAMLQAGMRGVAEHHFEAKGTNSEEQVKFANGKTLTILQSGCEQVRQEFRFELKETPPADADDKFWVDQTILNLAALAVLDPQLMPLGNWVMMIRAQKNDIRIAETKALEGGFYTKIDRITSDDRVYLVIVLSNYPT